MKYLSVCSGIEAATVAWKPLGWEAVAFSEIERFPSNVLAHHYPDTPNLGDMNDFQSWPDATVDVLVGGTPCQSFSVAGLRAGLADPRGNLALTFCAILERYSPRWFVWENVPGVLSSDGGRGFGAIVGAMVQLGYGVCWRVLDAQFFGIPQRRRRVFVVGHLGDWRRAAEVLFEPQSLRGDPAPSRESRQVAPAVPSRSSAGGGLGTDFDCDGGLIPTVANPLTARMHKGINTTLDEGQTPIVVHGTQDPLVSNQAFAKAGALPAIRRGDAKNETILARSMAVRRLTPLECERLQGFPDRYTDIPGASDSGRYKALGNSMAVPVMAWIGQRIQRFSGEQ